MKHKGQPTLILPKTVKGFGMGESGEGQMIAHQAKKMTQDAMRQFRDRFNIQIPHDRSRICRYYTFPEGSAEKKYLHERRAALGGDRRRAAANRRPSRFRRFRPSSAS